MLQPQEWCDSTLQSWGAVTPKTGAKKGHELILNALMLQPGKAVAQVPICKIPPQLKPVSAVKGQISVAICVITIRPHDDRVKKCTGLCGPQRAEPGRLIPLHPMQNPDAELPPEGPGALFTDLWSGSQGRYCVTKYVIQMETWLLPWTTRP